MGRKPSKNSATVVKIAEEVGVSTATVSRVFNRSDLVRPQVVERVLAAAARHNFTPRQATKKDTLVLVIEDENAPTFSAYVATMFKEMVHLCAERNLRLDILPATECRLLRGKYVMGAIGLLWEPASVKAFESIKGTSLVAINADTKVPSVCADEAQGMFLAVEHLTGHGHRRIGLVARNFETFGDQHRPAVFSALPMSSRVPSFECTEILFDGRAESLLSALARVMKAPAERRPTALIATSENTGIQVAHCLDLLGLRVPDDISVVSHEAAAQSEYLLPPHTTVGQDYRATVRTAVDLLGQPEAGRPARTLIPFHLTVRESVARVEAS